MPRREDIKKILVIGSGPIVIGQAAEFDYAGTQACQSLKEEGYEVVLINSNPATIMTDTVVADRVYIEPLTLDFASRIIYKERPDAILGSLGGQTGLNLVVELAETGILEEYGVEVLGTALDAIEKAEDRDKFRELIAFSEGSICNLGNTIWDRIRTIHFPYRISMDQRSIFTEEYSLYILVEGIICVDPQSGQR